LKLALNKSALQRERRKVALYRRYLPPLELKRQELLRRLSQAQAELAQLSRESEELLSYVRAELPMLANDRIDLSDLVQLTEIKLKTENALGVALPRLDQAVVKVRSYSPLARPHWVDEAVRCLKAMLELKVAYRVAERRAALLAQAVKRVTQRVNLLEKVLIPNASANIHRLQVYLEDLERAETLRAKLAKSKLKR
jgi:V/A-type H+-transporting ATPase subunit D